MVLNVVFLVKSPQWIYKKFKKTLSTAFIEASEGVTLAFRRYLVKLFTKSEIVSFEKLPKASKKLYPQISKSGF